MNIAEGDYPQKLWTWSNQNADLHHLDCDWLPQAVMLCFTHQFTHKYIYIHINTYCIIYIYIIYIYTHPNIIYVIPRFFRQLLLKKNRWCPKLTPTRRSERVSAGASWDWCWRCFSCFFRDKTIQIIQMWFDHVLSNLWSSWHDLAREGGELPQWI